MAECRVPFKGHCDLKLDLDLIIRIIFLDPRKTRPCLTERLLMGAKESNQTKNHIWSISILLFEVGIPNFVCECILEWRIYPFHFPVSVTLTSDLVSRIGIKSGALLLYSLR